MNQEMPIDMTPESWDVINKFKEEFYDVYYVQIYDQEFIYRLPSLEEFKKLETQYPNMLELQEAICRTYVLDPIIEDWDEDIPAGYVESLAKSIINDSGAWWDTDEVVSRLNNANQPLDSLLKIIPLTIKKAFPEYSFDELQKWNFPRQLEYYQYAKWIININTPEFEIELKKPNE